MPTHLNCCGLFWALFSFLGCTASSIGFFLPYWIRGTAEYNNTMTTVYIGMFRRCSYPILDDKGILTLVDECGMYTTFDDIPSIWWRVATIVTGIGCGLTILLAFTVGFGCCMTDVFSSKSARWSGFIQFIAALLVGGGVALYPLGWVHNRDVTQVCGSETAVYNIGRCTISWALYTCVAGSCLTLVATLFSCAAIYDDRYRKPAGAI